MFVGVTEKYLKTESLNTYDGKLSKRKLIFKMLLNTLRDGFVTCEIKVYP